MSQPVSPWTPARMKAFDVFKGYGFAYTDASGKDIFIHKSLLRRIGFTQELPRDRLIEVIIREGPKGREALDIRIPQ